MTQTRPRTSSRRLAARLGTGLVAGAVLVLLGAGAASAHIHVEGDGATRGGSGVLTFRVPNESDTQSTTAVTVTLPADTPIASVSVEPVVGWTAKVTTEQLAEPIETDDGQVASYVSRIGWTADDEADGIGPGEFRRFTVSAGPLPDVPQLSFPIVQRYGDGTEVSWNESEEGSAEAERPAPTLDLAPATQGHDATAGTDDSEMTASMMQTADGTGLAVGIGGAAIALVALVVAVIALLRGSKRAGA